ncbi:MAG: hypothetical protein PUK40_06870 [Actinomycetaceae bacterium]|nr:hypothetical protein [Arcanobacterium sp.]MDD7505643.1 hypothetical protein [Actinomycetaceae bacterium]MDY6143427.1 hypothetical protein [Arcanobacterium sp.]
MIFVLGCALVAVILLGPAPRRRIWTYPRRKGEVDPAVILDIAKAGLTAGLSIPTTLAAVHHALDDVAIRVSGISASSGWNAGSGKTAGGVGAHRDRGIKQKKSLNEVANSLLLGATWDEAWDGVDQRFMRIRDALEPAWKHGVAPVPLLERSAYTLRLSRQRHAKEAAARLGARLVMPLGLCFLPAFMLIGVLPVVVGTAQVLMP